CSSILPNTLFFVNPFFKKIFKKRKEDSFSSVKPTKIFFSKEICFAYYIDSRYHVLLVILTSFQVFQTNS
ncbi:hypothetical protein, partial [Eubacterium sp. AF22-8LB]|uniref:hypothetical protein n=1 Tax=Eubacterium sp. AF22-8LB TaxID=2292232 RepID=UPI001A9A5000